MKEFGKVILKAANDYPAFTIAATAIVAANVVYNVCVLIDRCAYYHTVHEVAKQEDANYRTTW